MLHSLNTAIVGVRNYQTALDVVANNLANLDTVGYKTARVDFAESMNSMVRAATADRADVSGASGIQIGNGMSATAVRSNYDQGGLNQTGLSTDLAISGKGFFMVRDTATGEVFATRSGNFHLDSTNHLVNDEGMRVQGITNYQLDPNAVGDIILDKGPNPPAVPATAATSTVSGINIDGNGRINVILEDGTQYVRGQVLLQNFNNVQNLTKVGNNLYGSLAQAGPSAPAVGAGALTGGGPILNGMVAPAKDGIGQIVQGSLELSNVDISREFSSMITTQRAFQANSKVVSTSDEILQDLINLKR